MDTFLNAAELKANPHRDRMWRRALQVDGVRRMHYLIRNVKKTK